MSVLAVHDFEAAGRAVLTHLQQRLGFALWMVTRRDGGDWIVLQAGANSYGVQPGAVLQWEASFCARMVQGQGPRVVPDADQVQVYAEAPIGRELPIRAYVGVPLLLADGSVFGTLCAIDPQPQPPGIVAEQALVELLAALLSRVLQAELDRAAEARRRECLELEVSRDPLTRLYDRRAWERLLEREEERCRRFGHPSLVLMADLDGVGDLNERQGRAAGDALLLRAAQVLRQAAREGDVVARLGGDEFAILAGECDAAAARALLERTQQALRASRIGASLGLALRHPATGLKGAWETADRLVYAEKSSR